MGKQRQQPKGAISIVGDDYLKTCGDRIGDHLESLSMTQAELAEELGVSGATVSRWINGLAEPRRQHKRALADVLGTKVHRLFAEAA